MNMNRNKVVEGNNEVVEAKKPGVIKQFIDKHEITPKKVAKAAVKALAAAGAVGGAFVLGRVTGKSKDDDQSDEADYYEVTEAEDSEI